MKPTINDFPYPNIPITLQGQLNKLSDTIGIRRNLLIDAGEKELQAMCYVVLYRHLTQQQRQMAMKTIHSIKKRALIGALIDKTLDTTFVNPQWGVWSLTNDELIQDIASHEQIQYLAGLIGVGASGMSIWELVQKVVKARAVGYKQLATLVIWGFVIWNNKELNKSRNELKNRTQINTSRFY
ncbi:hypothetical protein BIT28_00190 [Photobacterium proteolyticum]|uniref:Uncharacterized protein n=1 Tax=Photobacterium proteolyticum TaxID=1903952 RepID=A0A1Q9GTD1_9GAMM|nr:hypothetical protein [Photobacterium proteolyticum]OLQ78347.1 hypothetical protein BIT28_00190 [Photobacterium proteolyticum]